MRLVIRANEHDLHARPRCCNGRVWYVAYRNRNSLDFSMTCFTVIHNLKTVYFGHSSIEDESNLTGFHCRQSRGLMSIHVSVLFIFTRGPLSYLLVK